MKLLFLIVKKKNAGLKASSKNGSFMPKFSPAKQTAEISLQVFHAVNRLWEVHKEIMDAGWRMRDCGTERKMLIFN